VKTLLPTLRGDDDEALEGESEDEDEDAEGTRLAVGNWLETKRRTQRSF
jgi:hypothetical protein